MKERLFKGLIAVILSISFALSPITLTKALADNPPATPVASSETKDQQVKSQLERELPNVKSELIGKVGKCEFKTDTIWIYFRNNLIDIIGILGVGSAVGLASSVPFIGGLASSTSNAVNHVAANYIDAFIIGIISSLMLLLGGWLIQVVLSLNTDIMGAGNPIIKAGFNLSLGLANIGFVIALIIIGIFIILRRKDYGSAKTLTNLVIAIVLVNFSIFIARFFTEISDIFIRAFVGDSCVGITLFNKLGAHQIQNAFGSNGGQIFNVLSAPITIYIADLISIIAVILVFTILIYLVIRYVAVSLLIIAMPLAWLGFVFNKIKIPGIGNPWDYWWDNFIKWLIAGPMIAFFLYLMPYVIDIKVESTSAMGMIGVSLFHVITVIVISLGGIFITNKMSGIGSQFISKGVDAAFGGSLKAINKLRQIGGQTGQLSTEKQLQQYLEEQAKAGKAPDRGKIAAFQAKIAGYKGLAGQETDFTRKVIDQAGLAKRVPFTSISAKDYLESIGDLSKYTSSISGKKYKDISDEEAVSELARLDKVAKNSFLYDNQRFALIKKLKESRSRDKADLKNFYSSGLARRLSNKGIAFDKEFGKSFGMTESIWTKLHATKDDRGRLVEAEKELSGFYGKIKKEDFKNIPLDKIFKTYKDSDTLPFGYSKEELANVRALTAYAIAENPQFIGSAYTQLKGGDRENFEAALYSDLINNDSIFGSSDILSIRSPQVFYATDDIPAKDVTELYAKNHPEEYTEKTDASGNSRYFHAIGSIAKDISPEEARDDTSYKIRIVESDRRSVDEIRRDLQRLESDPNKKYKLVTGLRQAIRDHVNKQQSKGSKYVDLAKALNKQKHALGEGQFDTE